MIYLKLLLTFFQIGIVSFGGGYAAMAPIYKQVVTNHQWLSAAEFADLITISQMTPGPIALNSATFVGLRIAGFPGAIVATIGNILPSLIVVGILGFVYFRFSSIKIMQTILGVLRAAVVALIMIACISLIETAILLPNFNLFNLFLFIFVIILLNITKLDPTIIMVITGLIGVIHVLIT